MARRPGLERFQRCRFDRAQLDEDAGGSQIGFRPLKRRVAQLAIAGLGDDRLADGRSGRNMTGYSDRLG
jgi:hypothetical protein